MQVELNTRCQPAVNTNSHPCTVFEQLTYIRKVYLTADFKNLLDSYPLYLSK